MRVGKVDIFGIYSGMKKWAVIVAVAVVLLGVTLVVTSKMFLTKNYLVSELERSIDSRVQIGELEVKLFGGPARVTIKDVIIAERDDLARDEVPHDERPPIDDGAIKISEISFDVSLWELISKRIKVEQLAVSGLKASVVMDEDGKLNVEQLFAEPPKEKRARERREKKEGFNAKENEDFVTELKSLVIKDTEFSMVIEKTGLVIEGRDVNIALTDIKVDPNALEQVNEAHLQFSAHMDVFSNEKERKKFGQISLDGPARVKLFDPATGDLEPDAEVDFSIADDSYVSTQVPYVEKLWSATEKVMEKLSLEEYMLPDKLTFGRSKKVKASYLKGRVDLHEPLSLAMKDWELALDAGSWFESGSEEHQFKVLMIAGDSVSSFAKKHLSTLTDLVPEELRKVLHEEILSNIFIDDHLTLRVSTQGELSKPKVKLDTKLPDVEKMTKEYAKKKLLDYGMKKLFGDDDED